jgi:hypothetical protein
MVVCIIALGGLLSGCVEIGCVHVELEWERGDQHCVFKGEGGVQHCVGGGGVH